MDGKREGHGKQQASGARCRIDEPNMLWPSAEYRMLSLSSFECRWYREEPAAGRTPRLYVHIMCMCMLVALRAVRADVCCVEPACGTRAPRQTPRQAPRNSPPKQAPRNRPPVRKPPVQRANYGLLKLHMGSSGENTCTSTISLITEQAHTLRGTAGSPVGSVADAPAYPTSTSNYVQEQ